TIYVATLYSIPFFFSLFRPPPSSTLFPYTTLFRSRRSNPRVPLHSADPGYTAGDVASGDLPTCVWPLEVFHATISVVHRPRGEYRHNLFLLSFRLPGLST